MTFDVEILLWRSDLLRAVVSANSGQDASKKVGEAFSKTEGPMHTVTSLVLDDGQTVQVIHELTLADDIDVRSEEGFERGVQPGTAWDKLVNDVEAMFEERSTYPVITSGGSNALRTDTTPSVELKEAILRNKQAVMEALVAGNITSVTVSVAESDDDELMTWSDAYSGKQRVYVPNTMTLIVEIDEEGVPSVERETTLDDAIDMICHQYLDHGHPGWNNHEGTSGTFEFKVAERTIELGLKLRITSAEFYHYTF